MKKHFKHKGKYEGKLGHRGRKKSLRGDIKQTIRNEEAKLESTLHDDSRPADWACDPLQEADEPAPTRG